VLAHFSFAIDKPASHRRKTPSISDNEINFVDDSKNKNLLKY